MGLAPSAAKTSSPRKRCTYQKLYRVPCYSIKNIFGRVQRQTLACDARLPDNSQLKINVDTAYKV